MTAEQAPHRTASTLASSEWAIAPYAMVRFNPVQARATDGRLAEQLDALRSLRADRAELKQAVLDELFSIAPQVPEQVRKQLVLPTSRSVARDRLPRITPAQLTAAGISSITLVRWLELAATEGRLRAELADRLDSAMVADRQRLQQILGTEEFLLAAAITSPDMARSAQHYAETPVGEHTKRIRKHEPKLVRYAERAVAKTSPFSHFTLVGIAEWADKDNSFDIYRRVSRVQPNLLLIVRLLDLAVQHPGLAAVVPFSVRKELRHTAQGYEFEVMRDEPQRSRIYQGSRSQVTIGRSATTELVFDVLDQSGGQATFAELAEQLQARSAQPLAPDAVTGYLGKLRAAGLLVPSVRVDQRADRPAEQLADRLAALPGEAAAQLTTQLRQLQADTDRIAGLTGLDRADAVAELRSAWEQTFAFWGGQSRFDSPLYEDVSIAQTIQLNSDRWQTVQRDLTALLPALEPLNMDHPGQVLLRLMMVERHGPGGRCSYQDFISMLPGVFTAERVSLAAILAEVADRDLDLLRLLELREDYLDRIAAGVGQAEVVLESEFVRRLADQTPVKFRRGSASVSSFVQPISERDGRVDQVALNAMLDGNGQFLSRFLNLWAADRTEVVRSHLRRSLPVGSTELRPVQGFNANVHPAMLDAEFGLAEASDPPAAGAVDVRELSVRHDEATDRLVLQDSAGHRISPRYLGFLVPYLLPWELTGLYLLSEPSQLRIDSANELERRVPAGQVDRVRRYPRVRYGSVVLNRARWYVPAAEFPAQTSEETLIDFLVRFDDWRCEHEIPAHVFVVTLDGSTAETRDSLGRPKPMFTDLRSPLHLRCLPNWVAGAAVIRLEEALPDPIGPATDALFGNHVAEYLIEAHQTPVEATR